MHINMNALYRRLGVNYFRKGCRRCVYVIVDVNNNYISSATRGQRRRFRSLCGFSGFSSHVHVSVGVDVRTISGTGSLCFQAKMSEAEDAAAPRAEFRLPGDVIPLHYNLDIITYLEEDFCFQGKVKIRIKCVKPTDSIVVNARNLIFKEEEVKVTTTGETERSLRVNSQFMDTKNEFYEVKTERLVVDQEYILHLSFEAPLTGDLVGYYYSSYTEISSVKKKFLAVTHFEPSDARRAFPCFDEPGYKATFAIRLGHGEKYQAISNMPLQSTYPIEQQPGFVWSEFEQTVPMSTYLVAFMVSDFKFVQSAPHPNNITVRVYARPDALEQTVFPISVVPKFLTFYEDFFGLKYPLPKQDLVAVPDFKIGAMENWGLITFRESSLLLDEQTTSSTTRLHIASIIAHELAHMWFGNLVTMHWWTDLWLKEGFATYMAGLAVHHEFPEWNSLDADALSDLLRVFYLDSLKSSHPVSVPIVHSKEISQIFDAISYDKGSFLLRMMSLFLGEEVFRIGVNNYLQKHKYANAEQDDLWEALTGQAHRHNVLPAELSVKQIMDSWTLQTGYPIITITRDYENNKVTVTQRRFLANTSEDPADYAGSWWVPLSYSTDKEPDFYRTQPESWLPKGQESVELKIKATKDDWVIFNNRVAGLYRVNYDDTNWMLITKQLHSEEFEKIDVLNRALLIVDSMDLADCGLISYDTAIQLISYVEKETSFVPWNAALTKLEPIKSKLCRTPIFSAFKYFIQHLMKPVVENLKSLEETPSSIERGWLLSLIAQWSLPFGVGKFHDQAVSLFNKWLNSENPDDYNPIPKDVRRAVYSHAVQFGGEEIFSFLWKRYKASNVVAEKNNILMALTNTREVFLINRYLSQTLSPASGIRKQDAFIIFRVIATKEMGFYAAQKFFFRNIEVISQYFGSNSNLIGHYFIAIAEQMIYQYEYDELKAFSERYRDLLAPASLIVEQALETAKLNVQWMNEHYSTIGDTLRRIIPVPKTD